MNTRLGRMRFVERVDAELRDGNRLPPDPFRVLTEQGHAEAWAIARLLTAAEERTA